MDLDSTRSYREAAEYYDLFANSGDLDFFRQMASQIEGKILELACGTGRVSLELAKQGHEVVGIDAVEEMLEIAKKKAADAGSEVERRTTYVQGNLTDFSVPESFKLIIIPSSFKFNLTTEQQLLCLQSIKKHLDDDGIFILDHYPGGIRVEYDVRTQGPFKYKDCSVKRDVTIRSDIMNQIQQFTMRYTIEYPDGRKEEFQTSNVQSLIFEREIELLVRIAGFKIVEEYGDWDFSAKSDCYSRRILVLQKDLKRMV